MTQIKRERRLFPLSGKGEEKMNEGKIRKCARTAGVALAAAIVLGALKASAEITAIRPTVFLKVENNRLCQLVEVEVASPLRGEYIGVVSVEGETLTTPLSLPQPASSFSLLVPACPAGTCRASLLIRPGELRRDFDLSPPRRWIIYLSPFSHVDVGFTNSQRKILLQNLENLRIALALIETTRDYPPEARFKFFTEVSWPLLEFLSSPAIPAEEKEKMRTALRRGEIEAGGFLISHQNKFMPGEALFRSLEPALALSRETGAPLRTACLNDLADLSAVVWPLREAGISFLLAGPNTMHYIAPPLFYLQPPGGQKKVLVWLTPNLNGYGENFDFAMRPELPLTEEALAEIETRLGSYLKELESEGVPPARVRRHYDFGLARWPYPYDFYFLPFYPAHAVDNGPQDLTACELARRWNERWAWPRLVLATPAEFFLQAEEKAAGQIPRLQGELPGFWGEQVFFSFAQVDPAKEAVQREFERNAILYEMDRVKALFTGRPLPDLTPDISAGFRLLVLNNDHNPGPVPFGNTPYTREDVAEWKETRQLWIQEIEAISRRAALAAGNFGTEKSLTGEETIPVWGEATDEEVILENEFYRVLVDRKAGGIRSLVDKELGRELVSHDSEHILGQYVIVARGENAGVRENLFSRPGLATVKVELIEKDPLRCRVRISGQPARQRDELKVFSAFVEENFGVKIPSLILRPAVRLLKVRLGPVKKAVEEIELKAGIKAVFFTQVLESERDQAIDHVFAFPLNVPAEEALIIDGPAGPYLFSPVPPWGHGDLIPAAAMTDPKFPGINALTHVFSWIRGVPADAVFRNYVLARGEGFGIAFSSLDSGVILPGPLAKDAFTGPFGGGFYHLVLGWTAYGHAFLGAPREGSFTFRSALTSFAAADRREAQIQAARFGQWFTLGQRAQDLIQFSSPGVILRAARPLSERVFLLRLSEISGEGREVTVTLPPGRRVVKAVRAWLDGEPTGEGTLELEGNDFRLFLNAGEITTVRVELE